MTPQDQEGDIYEYDGECDPDDFEDNEPIGSCDNCESDIYESEDDGSGLCDQCQWYAAGCPEPGDSSDDEAANTLD